MEIFDSFKRWLGGRKTLAKVDAASCGACGASEEASAREAVDVPGSLGSRADFRGQNEPEP